MEPVIGAYPYGYAEEIVEPFGAVGYNWGLEEYPVGTYFGEEIIEEPVVPLAATAYDWGFEEFPVGGYIAEEIIEPLSYNNGWINAQRAAYSLVKPEVFAGYEEVLY